MYRISIGIGAIAGLAALLAAGPLFPAIAQEETAARPAPPERRPVPSLTVAGEGESRVAPDEATVRLGVLAQAPAARVAQEQVNRVAGAILEAVRRLGVPAAQVQTAELNLSPVYAQGRPGGESEPRIAGYQASNVVTVQLDKLDRVGPVIDAGLAAGANRLEGVGFGLRDDRQARAEALTAAVGAARAKAQALARALRLRLVQVLEVAEGGAAVTPPPVFGGRMAAMAADSLTATPVASGQVVGVTVRWQVEPCPAQGACE